MDEIADAVNRLSEFSSAAFLRRDRVLLWQWPRPLAMDGMTVSQACAELDSNGHFVLRGMPQPMSLIDDSDIVARNRAMAQELYSAILRRWPALHTDVERGIVRVGVTAVLVRLVERRRLYICTANPERLTGRTVSASQLELLLFTESCRQFVYSTTERYRQLGKELVTAREEAASGPTGQAELLSITANRRLEDIRTARTRLQIAVQVLVARQQSTPSHTGSYRQELADLALVADHMCEVWQMLELNFKWVVDHITLRVSIAERSSTRSFTAAVFAVAVVALLFDAADKSLVPQNIHWTDYRIGVLVGILAVVSTTTFLMYLFFRRMVR